MTGRELRMNLHRLGEMLRRSSPNGAPREACLDRMTIRAYYDGMIDDSSLEPVERHLAACQACRRYLARALEDDRTTGRAAGLGAERHVSPSTTPLAMEIEKQMLEAGREWFSALGKRLMALADSSFPPRLVYHPAMLRVRGEPERVGRKIEATLDPAQRLYEQGRFAEAARRLHTLQALDAMTHFYMGLCHLRLGDIPRAARHLVMATNLEPTVASYHWFLGQARLRAGDAPAALQAFQTVAALGGRFSLAARAKVTQIIEAVRLSTSGPDSA